MALNVESASAPPELAGVPRVSVIVLNYNGEKIIARCLDHLLAQTYSDYEIVVVDNASTDGSLAAMRPYLGSGRLSIVHSASNRGCPGGRNLGLRHAAGEILAFIDNDGFADPNWLCEIVKLLDANPRVGATASLVFFAGKRIILNGAGGTINRQGYGGDFCFNQPYEFAVLPDRVLYPMGCGMAVRRSVLERIGPFDEKLFNYYDDTELGIKVWKTGFEVALAPEAWVDHGFSYSDKIFNNKAFLCERNRLRTVIKYYPLRGLARWLRGELRLAARLGPGWSLVVARGWLWNLLHLPSALRWRLKFIAQPDSHWPLVDPSWGQFPPPTPNNQALHPLPARAGAHLILDGIRDEDQINFGWYYPESHERRPFRWTQRRASAYIRLDARTGACALTLLGNGAAREASLAVRPLGELPVLASGRLAVVAPGWQTVTVPCSLPAGDYELILSAANPTIDGAGRELGLAVAQIKFQ